MAILSKIVGFLKFVSKIRQLLQKCVHRKLVRTNLALHFASYLSIALSKTQLYWKIIKNAKKELVFRKSDPRRLSNFLQAHMFWKSDYISRTSNRISYRNTWFEKVIVILFRFFFSKKTRTLILPSIELISSTEFNSSLSISFLFNHLNSR